MSNYLLVLLCVALVVIGQLVLKYGIIQIGTVSFSKEQLISFMGKAVASPLIWIGFILYFVSAVLWLVVISRQELSSVQPITALSYVFITFFSWLLFKEDVGPVRILGVAAITLGVYLVFRS